MLKNKIMTKELENENIKKNEKKMRKEREKTNSIKNMKKG